jgi:hypothetical protein
MMVRRESYSKGYQRIRFFSLPGEQLAELVLICILDILGFTIKDLPGVGAVYHLSDLRD